MATALSDRDAIAFRGDGSNQVIERLQVSQRAEVRAARTGWEAAKQLQAR